MAYKIQYLKLGGILDQAIAVIKDNFGLLFTIMLLVWIPIQLVAGFLKLAATPDLVPGASMEEIMRAQEEIYSGPVPYLPLIYGLSFVQMLIFLPLMNASVIHAVARLYLGQHVTAVEAVKHAFRRLLPLIGTTILMYMAIFGGMILLIIPGILFALWFGLSQHVVVIEGLSGQTALKRSKKLVRPHLGTFLMLGLIVGAINFTFTISGQFIPQRHIAMLVAVVLSAVTAIVSTAAFVVFYFSCRCAEENFDLEYLAQSIGEAPPVEEPQLGAQQAY